MRQRLVALAAATGLVLGFGTSLSAPAGAASTWADARGDAVGTSLPVNEAVDLSSATVEADEPRPSCGVPVASVWATFTLAGTSIVQLDSIDLGDTWAMFAVFPHGSANSVMCASLNLGKSVASLPAGTYDVMVGHEHPSNPSINVSLQVLTPALNDSVEGAAPIAVPNSAVPYDTRAATLQPGEATPCNAGANATVWYSFVAPPSGHVTMLTDGMITGFALFRGSSPADLVYSGHCFQGAGSFGVTPGDTYLLQVATEHARTDLGTFDFYETPPLGMELHVFPSNPQTGETVFASLMPDGSGYSRLASCSFDFGDGSPLVESTDCVMASFAHAYAAGGVYTVTARATTEDGRSAVASTTVTVEAVDIGADVGIAAVKVPFPIKVGKAKSIAVRVLPTATPQSVVVTLSVSTAQGYQTIGSLTRTLPAGKHGLTLRFRWVPTAKQAQLKKVTLRATVGFTDPNTHDTNPSDNELITRPFRIVRR